MTKKALTSIKPRTVEREVARPKAAVEADALISQGKEEYLNKPTILHNTLLALYGGDYKSSSYTDSEGEVWQLTKMKLPDGGRVVFRYTGESETALKDVINTVSYALNEVYPLFDRQVGSQISGAREIAEHAGLTKRKKIIKYGNLNRVFKEIESYHTRSLKEHNEKLLEAGRVSLEFENIPFTAYADRLTRGGKLEKEKKGYKLRGTGALVNTVESGGRVAFTPHPIIMLAAYGQTVDAARDTTKDTGISRIRQQDFFISLKPKPQERRQLQEPVGTFENIIDNEINNLKRGDPTRAIPVSRFRPLFETPNEREFRRRFKKNLEFIKSKNGGKFWFTPYANKRGRRSETEFLDYLLVDYKTYKPYIKKTILQKTPQKAS